MRQHSMLPPLIVWVTLAGCDAHQRPASDRPVAAKVAGIPIYLDEFEAELARLSLDEAEGLPSTVGNEVQRRVLLDNLIERRMLLLEAEKNNVVVGMGEVRSMLQRIQNGFATSTANRKCEDCTFGQVMAKKNLSEGELSRKIRELLMIRTYFRDHVFSRVAVTDQEIEDYIENHPERLLEPEQVRAKQVVVKSRTEADNVLREIRRGMAFEDAALKYSLSPEGKSGGDLGYFPRGVMPAVFDEQCFDLKPGQLSKVVSSDYGFHIFKVTDRLEEQEKPVERVRQEIEAELRRQKEDTAQNETVAKLKSSSNIEVFEDVLREVES